MASHVAARVKTHRDNLRASGLRPIQIWVPDTRRPGFAEECARQSKLIAEAEAGDHELDAPLVRLAVDPSPENGLRKESYIQVDKAMTLRRERVGAVIGHLDDATMIRVNRAMAVFLGIA